MGEANGMNSFDTALYWAIFGQPDPASVADITGSWGEIADVISINGVPMERSVTDVTHLRSPNKAKEKVPGFLDAGQNTFRLNYYKTLMTALQTLAPGGSNAQDNAANDYGRLRWAVVMPDHGVWVFSGFIKSNPVEVPEDNRNTIEVTVEISGKPTWFEFV